MEINGEKTFTYDGKDYLLINAFCRLTGRTRSGIMTLLNKGNRIRKLKCIRLARYIFIEANELFNFPFIGKGTPSNGYICVNKYYYEGSHLKIKSEYIKNE